MALKPTHCFICKKLVSLSTKMLTSSTSKAVSENVDLDTELEHDDDLLQLKWWVDHRFVHRYCFDSIDADGKPFLIKNLNKDTIDHGLETQDSSTLTELPESEKSYLTPTDKERLSAPGWVTKTVFGWATKTILPEGGARKLPVVVASYPIVDHFKDTELDDLQDDGEEVVGTLDPLELIDECVGLAVIRKKFKSHSPNGEFSHELENLRKETILSYEKLENYIECLASQIFKSDKNRSTE